MADMFGSAANDKLTGTADSDRIFGFAGNDTLSGGGGGTDILNGGDGNDRYVLNAGDEHDVIVDTSPDFFTSFDTVEVHFATTKAYVIPVGVEELDLTGDATKGSGDARGNVIIGLDDGTDYTLDGGAGGDQLTGHGG